MLRKLVKLKYLPERDQRRLISPKLRNRLPGEKWIRWFFGELVTDVFDSKNTENGVHLGYCFSNANSWRSDLRMSLTAMIFPINPTETVGYRPIDYGVRLPPFTDRPLVIEDEPMIIMADRMKDPRHGGCSISFDYRRHLALFRENPFPLEPDRFLLDDEPARRLFEMYADKRWVYAR